MKIRPASLGDTGAILAIERESATAAHWAEEHYVGSFRQDGPRRLILVAEEEGVLIGFLVARAGDAEWEIENVAVTRGAQHRGTGTGLVSEVLKRAHEAAASAVFLEVRASNLAARRLYEKSGFVQDGLRKSYYRAPDEDAVHYALRFEQSQPA